MPSPSFGSLRMRGKRVGQRLLTAPPLPHSAGVTLLSLCWRQFLHLKSQLWVQGHNRLSLYKKGTPIVPWFRLYIGAPTVTPQIPHRFHFSEPQFTRFLNKDLSTRVGVRNEKRGGIRLGPQAALCDAVHTLLSTSQTEHCDEVFLFSYKHVLSQLWLT